MKSDEVKKRLKENILNKYGVDHFSKTDEFKEKFKITNLKKYGVDNPFKSDIIKQKIKKTNLEKYGFENPSQNLHIHNKVQKNSYKKIQHNGIDIIYQGTYELDFINFCLNNNIVFEKGPSIKYKMYGKNRVYHSDFYIPHLNLICEIKSSWTIFKDFKENLLKQQSCNNNGYNFIFIIDKNYDSLKELL